MIRILSRSLCSKVTTSSPERAAAALLEAGKLKSGDVLVQNEADSELGQAVIQLARERGIKTINVITDKPGLTLLVEKLKHVGGDIVVSESYTNTWYIKRLLSDLPNPSLGITYSDGSAATAVAKLLPEGGTLLTCGTQLSDKVAYGGAERRPILWSQYLETKNLKSQSV